MEDYDYEYRDDDDDEEFTRGGDAFGSYEFANQQLRQAITGVDLEGVRRQHEAHKDFVNDAGIFEEDELVPTAGISRGDFLEMMESQADGIVGRNSYVVSYEGKEEGPIGPGMGVVEGKIKNARGVPLAEGGSPAEAFVKVSAVEPGKKPLMLRCKTPIHATEAVMDPDGNPDFSNGSFTFQMDAPPDWGKLRGDLLFTVYDSSLGHNSFVGQVLFPLRDLVDDSSATGVHGGKQQLVVQEYRLQSRDCRRELSGRVSLSLQLTLPPSQKVGDGGGMRERDRERKALQMQREIDDKKRQQRRAAQRQRGGDGEGADALADGVEPALAWMSLKGKKASRRVKQNGQVAAPRSVLAKKGQGHASVRRRKEADRIARENLLNKRKLKEVRTKGDRKVKAVGGSRVSSGSSRTSAKSAASVNRTQFEQRIARENKRISRRLAEVSGKEPEGMRHGMDEEDVTAGMGSASKAKAEKAREELERRRRHLAEKKHEDRVQRRYEEQAALVSDVAALQRKAARLREEQKERQVVITRMKGTRERDTRVLRSMHKLMAEEKTHGGNGDVDSESALAIDPMGGGSSADQAKARRRQAALSNETLAEKVKLWDATHEGYKQKRAGFVEQIRVWREQAEELKVQLDDTNSKLRWAKSRRRWRRATSGRAGAPVDHSDRQRMVAEWGRAEVNEHEALDKAQSEALDLQVEIQAMEIQTGGSHSLDADAGGGRMGLLERKMDQVSKDQEYRIDHLRGEIEVSLLHH
jgi:hypothetical protein